MRWQWKLFKLHQNKALILSLLWNVDACSALNSQKISHSKDTRSTPRYYHFEKVFYISFRIFNLNTVWTDIDADIIQIIIEFVIHPRQHVSLNAMYMQPSLQWTRRTSAFPGTILRLTLRPECAPHLKPWQWERKLIKCPATCARYIQDCAIFMAMVS